MKISLVIAEGCKQVMFTPETKHEKEALKLIAPGETLVGTTKWGRFDGEKDHSAEQVMMCRGGYLRRFAEAESLMFVIEEQSGDLIGEKK